MRGYVFVRYHSGDGAGHVGWAFDLPDGRAACGSVENHSGHLLTPAPQMGFWQRQTYGFLDEFAKRGYNDVCVFEVDGGAYVDALRVVKWIESSAYQAIARNCEDDVYDVLRTFGIDGLEAPFFNWFPRFWFRRLHGRKMSIDAYRAEAGLRPAPEPGPPVPENLTPLRPDWRKPFHQEFALLNLAKVFRFRPSA